MKDFIKKYVLGFTLGAIIFGPLSYVTATTIAARNITYNGSNTNANLTNVQDAIERLYYMSEPHINLVIENVSYTIDAWGENTGYIIDSITLNENVPISKYVLITNHDGPQEFTSLPASTTKYLCDEYFKLEMYVEMANGTRSNTYLIAEDSWTLSGKELVMCDDNPIPIG